MPCGNSALNLRQVMFRPNWAELRGTPDHPNFTGSNPNFNPIWDGITPGPTASGTSTTTATGSPDSVWVDLGLPVRYTVDGQAYKPLFAILCLDMDGRLNLNAHGCYAQTQRATISRCNELASVPAVEQPARLGADARPLPGIGIGTLPAARPILPARQGPRLHSAGSFAAGTGYGTGGGQSLAPVPQSCRGPRNFSWPNFRPCCRAAGDSWDATDRRGPAARHALPGVNGFGFAS